MPHSKPKQAKPKQAKPKQAAAQAVRSRREVLVGIGLGVGAAAALPLAATPARGAEEGFPEAEETRGRYKPNDWIERYYALNRL